MVKSGSSHFFVETKMTYSDRNTALQFLHCRLLLGYSIERSNVCRVVQDVGTLFKPIVVSSYYFTESSKRNY